MNLFEIRKIIGTIDHDQIRTDLTKLFDLLENPIFLKGIGKQASGCMPIKNFKVIQDYGKAAERMIDQSVWDLPEPWPYQYFPDIVESESGRLKYGILSTKEKEKIDKYCKNFISDIKDIYVFMQQKWQELEMKTLIHDKYIEDWIFNTIYNDFLYLINFCTYGGFAASPILCRFYEAFLTGGAPCSWVGPLPEDGGDPKECLQILYRGPVADPSLIVG